MSSSGVTTTRTTARSPITEPMMGRISLPQFAEWTVRLPQEPFTFCDRPYLQDVYRSTARRIVIRASRQVEKSTFLANTILYAAYFQPGIRILVVSPRFEQSLLFS